MKVKLKNKDNPISLKSGWCFMNSGFDPGIINNINSGKVVEVDRIHPYSKDYLEEIKEQKTTKKGDK